MTFADARAVLLTKDRVRGRWEESEVVIGSVESLRSIFHPYEDKVAQIDLDMHRKVYYCIEFLDVGAGIDAKFVDSGGNLQVLASPILLVQCDDEKPIDMTDGVLRSMKALFDFS